MALIDARQLDYYHRLERERTYNSMAEDVLRSLDDMEAGRTMTAAAFKKKLASLIKK